MHRGWTEHPFLWFVAGLFVMFTFGHSDLVAAFWRGLVGGH